MSDKGKGGKVRKSAQSRSVRAGLAFPVGRIHRLLKKGNYAERIGAGSAVYLASGLEYLSAEMQHVTTRRLESSQDIFNWQFETMKN